MPAGSDSSFLQQKRLSVSKLTSFPMPSESRVRFLILGTRWRINAKDELKCDGLLCKTCREGLQIFAVFKDECLQVDQLTDTFGQ